MSKAFTAEFKVEAAKLVLDQNYTHGDAAKAMNVSLSAALLNKSDFGQVSPVVGCVFRQYARFQAYLLSSFCSALVPGP